MTFEKYCMKICSKIFNENANYKTALFVTQALHP